MSQPEPGEGAGEETESTSPDSLDSLTNDPAGKESAPPLSAEKAAAPSEKGGKKKDTQELARKSTLGIGSNFLIPLFGFISLIIIKREMGYEAVGIIAFSLSLCQIFGILGDLGFRNAHLKRVGEGLDQALCDGTYLGVKLVLSFVMAATVLGWFFTQKFLFGFEFETEHYEPWEFEMVFYLIVVHYIFLNMNNAFKTVFAARLKMAKSNIPYTIGRFLVMLGKVTVALVSFGIVYLAGAEILGSVLMLGMYLLLLRNYPLKKPSRESVKNYAVFAFPMVFVGLVGSLAFNVDKVVLGYLTSSRYVGIYTVPQSIVTTLLLVSATITTILFVVFSELYEKGDLEKIREISRRAEKYISIVLLPVIAFCFVFAAPLLELVFGKGSDDSAPVFQVMLVALYIEATLNPYNVQIAATGHLREAMYLTVLALGLNILLDLLLVPEELLGIPLLDMGPVGAALGTLITLALRSVFARFYANRITGTRPDARMGLHLFSALLTGGLLYLLHTGLFFHWALLLAYGPLALGVYLGIMNRLGQFGREELHFYLDAVHPGKMKRYILGEMGLKR